MWTFYDTPAAHFHILKVIEAINLTVITVPKCAMQHFLLQSSASQKKLSIPMKKVSLCLNVSQIEMQGFLSYFFDRREHWENCFTQTNNLVYKLQAVIHIAWSLYLHTCVCYKTQGGGFGWLELWSYFETQLFVTLLVFIVQKQTYQHAINLNSDVF